MGQCCIQEAKKVCAKADAAADFCLFGMNLNESWRRFVSFQQPGCGLQRCTECGPCEGPQTLSQEIR